MKRLALFLVLLLSLAPIAHADEVSRRAKAKEMVGLLHLNRLMAQMMDNMKKQTAQMSKQMTGGNMTPADQAKLDDFQQRVFTVIDAKMGWKEMEPEYITLYAKTFTEDELDSILVFYRSPAGVSMVEKLPALTAEATQLSQAKLAEIQPQLMQMISDFAKSAAAPPSTAPKQ